MKTDAHKSPFLLSLIFWVLFESFTVGALRARATTLPELFLPVDQKTRIKITNMLAPKLNSNQGFDENELSILTSDLETLSELRGSQVESRMFSSIFGFSEFKGVLFLKWVMDNFNILEPSRGSTCGILKEAEYVGCFSPIDRKYRLTPLFFKQDRLFRLTTLIHEVRHSQGFHHGQGGTSDEDKELFGPFGTEWSFLAAISSNCSNCLLMDKISAYKMALAVRTKLKGLSDGDRDFFLREQKSLRDPTDSTYAQVVSGLKLLWHHIHDMPSICINGVAAAEFEGFSQSSIIENCIVFYHWVLPGTLAKNPQSLKIHKERKGDFLIIYHPVLDPR